MIRRILALLIVFCLTINMNTMNIAADSLCSSDEHLELFGESALLMDAATGTVLYEKDGFEKRAVASTTKILTCLIALESADLRDVVTVSANAASQPDVQMHAEEGEQYILYDLLIGMMLESYNDISVAVAEHISGTVEGFAEKMNQKAKEIGCKNSFFITPNGLDSIYREMENESNAYDLALILCEALKNTEFLSITRIRQHTIHEINDKRTVLAYNRNAFLDLYEGVLTGKTGFTGKAGYCYAGAVKQEDRTFVAVTLGSGWPPHKTYKWKDMKTLFDYGFKNFEYKTIEIEEHEKNIKIPVRNGKGTYYKQKVYTAANVELGDTKRLLYKDDRYYGKLKMSDYLEAPVYKGQKAGTYEIYVNDTFLEEYDVLIAYDVEKLDFLTKTYQILRYIIDKICGKSIEIT